MKNLKYMDENELWGNYYATLVTAFPDIHFWLLASVPGSFPYF